ncbi:AraC family transcriptional regulator [Gracilibacillus suaedae]|uniref:AraC family transcriptional regulator n=1 Tax=Gracilibacillus suaedae TaxID=2820273 RepID=UPI001ABE92BD|nr:AraC family transcriptional regulator [Gracilibacillus suaedae]
MKNTGDISNPRRSNNLQYEYVLDENIHYCFDTESDFLRLFRNGDMRSIELLKNNRENFVQTLATSKNRSLKNNLIVLVANLTRAAIESGCNPNEMVLLMTSTVKDIENRVTAFDKEVFFELETKILLIFIRKIKQNRMKGLSKPSRMIVHYVQEHLSQQITLNDLALYCGRHPNYLSALFKRETNKNIQSYILEERINKAKYLIKHSDYLFVEIAHLCGFESQSYFTVQFKKIVGCTPKEYRNR